jgi:DNA-directed RNA polymerase subunit RPC12/RpoP
MAGRRARCDACNESFLVPALSKANDAPSQAPMKRAPPAVSSPQLIGLECRVCGTRLYGRADQVGKKIKCPDCGAGTVIPEPPKPKPLNMPAALEGEQYELWDFDEQPLPSELIAAQPKYIAVTCAKCGSLMYANENQVGQQIACPDCGTKHAVPPRPKAVKKPSVLAADRDTPKLDPAAAPGDLPPVIPHTLGLTVAEQRQEAEYTRALEKSQRTGRPMELDARGRAVLPRFPLLTGVVWFPFSAGCSTRWLAVATGLAIWAGLIVDGVPGWITWQGDSGGALKAMGGLGETMVGAVGAIIWFAAVANIVIAIASQSAVGADRIEDWPPMNFIHSLSEMLPLGVAIVFAAAPGWMLAQLLSLEPWQAAALAGSTLVLGLPIVVLSQLAGNSTWELIDLGVLGAAVRCPFSMILFYCESACLLAACAAAVVAAWQVNPYLPLAAAPLIVGCVLLYARLLGRLGWRLAEKIPVEDATDDDQRPTGPKNYNPPRAKKSAM